MALIDLASGKSLWRGVDYYENRRVISVDKIGEYTYSANVKGGSNNEYSVFIDIVHPRKSKCNCPFAEGRRVICKHMVAVYFSVFPKEAKDLIRKQEEHEEEFEEQMEEEYEEVREYVYSLSKEELRQSLINYILSERNGEYW